MNKVVGRCLYCNKDFILPEEKGKFIVKCPHCGFLQVYLPETGELTVPTHIEEDSLPRYDGLAIDQLDDSGETTLVQQDFNLDDLPIPPGLELSLEVINGPDKGKIFHLKRARTRIGRKDVEIPLDDKKVSRKHAAIETVTRENVLIRDLASRNGTFLNGVLVFTKRLEDGDIIRVGDTEIKIHLKRK